jgi:hypothetical protein
MRKLIKRYINTENKIKLNNKLEEKERKKLRLTNILKVRRRLNGRPPA